MSRETYELESIADDRGIEVFRDDNAPRSDLPQNYFYRLTEKGLEGLPADFDNAPVGPFGSAYSALRAALFDPSDTAPLYPDLEDA